MACTPTPTATLYATVTALVASTSYSQSVVNADAQVTAIVQQSCVASGTINGSSVGCISSVQVTQSNTVGGGGGQFAQIPIVVSVPTVEIQPTQTLFASCAGGDASSSASQTPVQSTINIPVTTSVLVQSALPPTTVVETSSTTLADGSVVQTVLTTVTTLPPTAVYVPTSLTSPSLQSESSHGSGTNVAPIVGGVLGGFLGLIVLVGSLWWLCRRRRSWDDIFEKQGLHNDDIWAPTVSMHRSLDGRRLDSSTDPRPYQYGLVGHVIPPAASGEPTRTSFHGSISEHSGMHSRNTSLSAVPLLQGTRTGSSRPSTAGSTLAPQPGPGQRVLASVGPAETNPRSPSTAPQSNSTTTPALLGDWTPNTDDLAVLEPSDRCGSPVLPVERRVLQIVNNGPPSPTDTMVPGARRSSSGRSSSGVIVHTDGGRVPEGLAELDPDPPAYSR